MIPIIANINHPVAAVMTCIPKTVFLSESVSFVNAQNAFSFSPEGAGTGGSSVFTTN